MAGMGGDAGEAAPYGAPVDDRRLFVHAALDHLEARTGADLRWMGEAWIGTDSNRLWLRSEGRTNGHGRVDDGQQELLYDRPVSPYFDLVAGARYDLDSRPGRGWAAFGVQGLAPYGAHLALTAYVGEAGRAAARVEASYDLLVTQRLILQPEAEVDLYSQADPARRIGQGLSDLDAGLRLRYEITRKFAPYIGFSERAVFGRTARLAHAAAERSQDARLAVGLRAWF